MMDRWALILVLVFLFVPSVRAGVTTKSAEPGAEAVTAKTTKTIASTAQTASTTASTKTTTSSSTTTTAKPCLAHGKKVICGPCEKCSVWGNGCISICKECESCHGGKCVYDKPGYCYGPGLSKCYKPGFFRHHADKERPNGYEVCNQLCDPATSNSSLIHAPVGTPCDDGYFCTAASVCVNSDKYNVKCMAKSEAKTGPCTQSFCKSVCNEKVRRCESPCNSTCRSESTCEDGADGQGTCGTIPLDSPPSCATCPCDRGSDMICNYTSGQCFVPSSTTSQLRRRTTKRGNKGLFRTEYFVPSVIGGVVGGAFVVVVVVVVLFIIKRRRIENFELRTVYHKVDGKDAQTQIIDKGL